MTMDSYCPPVFSEAELQAMTVFHEEWSAIRDEYDEKLALSEVQKTKPWERLRRAATAALQVFSVRGVLPEDEEV